MAKPKSPLLSLGAKGTIGDALTFQKRGRDTIAREKPIPKDPYSLNQAYQRWDYRDYAYLWTLLSSSDKQVYRTKASRYHITGFSQFMRESLKTLTDLEGRWHLDEATGAVAQDSSKNTNHGTIIGASSVDGIIDLARHLDGVNDEINCGNDLSLRPEAITVEFFITTPDPLVAIGGPGSRYYLTRYDYGNNRRVWGLNLQKIGAGAGFFDHLGIALGDPADGSYEYTGYYNFTLSPGTPYHIAFTFEAGTLLFYVAGQLVTLTATVGAVPASLFVSPVDLLIGGALNNGITALRCKSTQDEVRLYSRALTQPELLRHSLRHYP